MEEAMQRAAKSRYGAENEIRVEIDPKTGETHISRYLHVVDAVENDKIEISMTDARRRNPAAQVGDIIAETLPPIEFSRIATQAAKQVIVQKVRDAERERQYDEYKDRIGEIVHGTVKRVEFGSVVVDFGRAEGVVRRDEMIPRESFRNGDRIRAYIYDVRREIARTADFSLAHSSAIHGAAVRPGSAGDLRRHHRNPRGRSRSRFACENRGRFPRILRSIRWAPASACAGFASRLSCRSCRANASTSSRGMPILRHSSSMRWRPRKSPRLCWTKTRDGSKWWCPTINCRSPSARRGQNVRLASQLTGWQIDILTEQEESERRQKEFAERTQLFMQALDVDETIAQLLASEGFASVEDVAYVPLHELAEIEGFDEETAQELQSRAVGTYR